MLLSMTGYGEARYQSDQLNLSIELRSLNNRHLKLIVRAPEPYNLLEPEFEKIVRGVIRRGTVQMNLHCKRLQSIQDFQLNAVAIESYATQLKELAVTPEDSSPVQRSRAGANLDVAWSGRRAWDHGLCDGR